MEKIRRMLRRCGCALLVLSWAMMAVAQRPSYGDDPKFQKEVAEAKKPHQFPDDQIGHWKKANKIAGGGCLPCLGQILQLEYGKQDVSAVKATAAEIEQRSTVPGDRARAELMVGSVLFHAHGDKPKPEQLQEAEASFSEAVKADPKLHTALYMEGRTLALLHRDDDAKAAFARYVATTPATDRYHTRASHFAETPALAREKMAPPFTVTTAEGKQFTLDDMGGRVVLVDFWATWCGPCNEELPHVKRIAEEFAGQPFVLISVSWDRDAAKWQEFIDKHGMRWNQYRDADHSLSEAYGVDAIPHYFTIDADGVLQKETIGSGSDIEGRLRKLVARAKASETTPTAVAGDATKTEKGGGL